VLPGYGVELSLKNTEYSALDDKKKAPPSPGALRHHACGVSVRLVGSSCHSCS
jgi:hypothetical protein